MHSSQLIKQVKNYAKTLLEENLPKEMVFHNVNHTVQVVEQCKLLVSYCNLPDMDKNALLNSGHGFMIQAIAGEILTMKKRVSRLPLSF